MPVDRGGPRLGAGQPDRPGADGRRALRRTRDASTSRRASALAWDVFGDGSTSVRGGYGLYFNTNNQQNLIVTVTNPPATPRFVIANPTFPNPPFERGIGNTIRPMQWDLRARGCTCGTSACSGRCRRASSRRSATPARAARTCSATPTSTSRRRRPTADGRPFFAAGLPRPNRNFGTIELKSSDGDSLVHAR